MAYTNHAGALWRWRSASELGVDQELKEKFKHLRQPISRPSQDKHDEADTTTDDMPSISDEEVAS